MKESKGLKIVGVSATYTIRLTLGNYQHEELTLTYAPELGEKVSGLELLNQAREDVLKSTTAAKRKAELNGKIEHPGVES